VTAPALPPVLDVRDVTKVYGDGDSSVHALRGVSLEVGAGEFVAVMGASGSGKSTLMHVLGCLDVPTAGRYMLDGLDVARMGSRELAMVRNRKIGFVFQAFNLVPRTTTLANVELPMAYGRVGRRERRDRAMAALELVGLADRAGHLPNQMSGGQQQRAAVARALVMSPSLILADEPTGNLDSASTDEVMAVFDQVHRSGRTIVVITHEDYVASHASRAIHMRDGRIISDSADGRAVA
jgi:putative ABC transport system ATP-binding protein